MNEHKFTPRAEEALRLSQEAAGELGHGYVGTEHLLLGLMRESEGLAHTVLTEAGLTGEMLVEIIKKSVGAGLPGSNPAQGLTPRARRVVESAMEDSVRGGYNSSRSWPAGPRTTPASSASPAWARLPSPKAWPGRS